MKSCHPYHILSAATLILVVAWMDAGQAVAQRPIRMFDPFYRGETAKRTFYDRYAVTAELSYRPPGFFNGEEGSAPSISRVGGDALGMNLRVEYRLGRQVNLGAFLDAMGGSSGRSLQLTWLTAKYFRHDEGVDYAVRLAINPSSDSRSGFPQMDLGFLYSSLMSETVTTDFGIGVRRVQVGFQEITAAPSIPAEGADPVTPSAPVNQILRGRAHGWEVHLSSSYNIVFDPAGSNIFGAFLLEGGRYNLVEWIEDNPAVDGDEGEERTSRDYRGGVIWVRTGLEVERPGYQFAPFLAIPVTQWAPDEGEWPASRAHVGLRLMLR